MMKSIPIANNLKFLNGDKQVQRNHGRHLDQGKSQTTRKDDRALTCPNVDPLE